MVMSRTPKPVHLNSDSQEVSVHSDNINNQSDIIDVNQFHDLKDSTNILNSNLKFLLMSNNNSSNHWFDYMLTLSGVKVFGSIIDNMFGYFNRNKAVQEQKSTEEIRHNNQKDLEHIRHNNRTDEQQKVHDFTIQQIREKAEQEKKAQEREHEHQNQRQKKDYEYKLNLNEQAYYQRISEIGYKTSLDRDNIFLSSQLQLFRDLIVQYTAHENAKELEELRLVLARIDRGLKRAEENSPFTDVFPERLIQQYYQELNSRKEQQPLLLIAPFYYNNHPNQFQKEGGFQFPTFNDAIDQAVESKLSQIVVSRDGYLRALYHKGRDIDHILPYLAHIPTILIHGRVLEGESVEPIITFWNLPGCLPNSPRNFPIGSFKMPPLNSGQFINFQNALAQKIMELVGMLSDAYHLVINGKRPNLRRYLNDTEQIKILAQELGFYYQLISEAEPTKEPIYRLDQAMMLGECGLIQEAIYQTQNALQIWYSRKPDANTQLDFSQLEEDVSSLVTLVNTEDQQFLSKLAETYQLIDKHKQVEQVHNLLSGLQPKKIKPIPRFMR
jgi:hypothetical protein